ncbi:Ubiquitin [Corchorus capsularis]|uniref:Ubiquitin n=1 Tax=Corchorus capsularis TaxID=210143 RepID=A0A1R3JKE8_COCAP|nr:Ubiquitin [Corchorus capsularis]
MASSRAKRPLLCSPEEEVTVYLKLMKTLALRVKPAETVEDFKALLYEKGIISEDIQNLSFAGQPLNDGQRLVDHGIQRYSCVDLTIQNFDLVKFYVTIPSEHKTIVVEARAEDTVQEVKSYIQAIEGIESDRFSLVYQGYLLEEDRTLSSLNIVNNSTLCLAYCQKDVISIYVKALTGEVVKLQVKRMFTVGDVKAIAGSMLSVSSLGSLFNSGQHLDETKVLAFYDIKEESMLEMLHPVYQIFVKTWSGKTYIFNVQQNMTVKDLKDKLYEKLKIPVHLQSLIFAGKRLEAERDLASYSIQKNCTVYMVFAPSSTIKYMKLSTISTHMSLLNTVGTLKQKIGSKEGVEVKEIKFHQRTLLDDFTLQYYGINKETTLTVVF